MVVPTALPTWLKGLLPLASWKPSRAATRSWLDATGSIAGNVEDSDVDEFVERLADKDNWRIDWLPADEAGFIADASMRLVAPAD